MNNIKEAINYIYSFMGKKNLHKNNNSHINNVQSILEQLKYKQKFKVIHVTGTKGKGSTTLVLAHFLKSAGYKTGAFISPHIINERERISINDEWISEKDFIDIIIKIKNIIDNNTIYSSITVFEIFTIIGLYYFYKENTDYACIEVGIGGKFDSTNIVNPIISIITSISYDHTDILGSTIEEITEQKAGIIKENSIVISAYQEEKSIEIIKQISKEKNSNLYIFKNDFDSHILENTNNHLSFTYKDNLNNSEYNFNTVLLGEHQSENISLSFKAFTLIIEKNIENIETKISNKKELYINTSNSLENFTINARLTFMHRNPDIIVDGAHNKQSLERVLSTIYQWYDEDIIILFAPLSEKDIKGMCSILKKYDSNIILSSPSTISYKESNSNKTYEYLKESNNVEHIANFKDAFEYACSSNNNILVIGSLYAASEFISMYKNKN